MHARKVYDRRTNTKKWEIVLPSLCGFPVMLSQCQPEYNIPLDLEPDATLFLTELLSQDGLMHGWSLFAVGRYTHVNGGKQEPFFDFFLAREKAIDPPPYSPASWSTVREILLSRGLY